MASSSDQNQFCVFEWELVSGCDVRARPTQFRDLQVIGESRWSNKAQTKYKSRIEDKWWVKKRERDAVGRERGGLERQTS